MPIANSYRGSKYSNYNSHYSYIYIYIAHFMHKIAIVIALLNVIRNCLATELFLRTILGLIPKYQILFQSGIA